MVAFPENPPDAIQNDRRQRRFPTPTTTSWTLFNLYDLRKQVYFATDGFTLSGSSGKLTLYKPNTVTQTDAASHYSVVNF